MRCSPPRLVKIPFSSVMDHGFTWMLCLIQDGILFCFVPLYSAALSCVHFHWSIHLWDLTGCYEEFCDSDTSK